jgi:hypothetical protein
VADPTPDAVGPQRTVVESYPTPHGQTRTIGVELTDRGLIVARKSNCLDERVRRAGT